MKLRRVLLDELADRSKLAHLALTKWNRTQSPRDRVRVSAVAEWLAAKMDAKHGSALSWRWRRKCRHAMALAGFARIVKVDRVAWYTGIVER